MNEQQKQVYQRVMRGRSQAQLAKVARALDGARYEWNGFVLVIESETHPGTFYRVNGSCQCPARHTVCWHRLVREVLRQSWAPVSTTMVTGTPRWQPFEGVIDWDDPMDDNWFDRVTRYGDRIAIDDEEMDDLVNGWKRRREQAAHRLVYG